MFLYFTSLLGLKLKIVHQLTGLKTRSIVCLLVLIPYCSFQRQTGYTFRSFYISYQSSLGLSGGCEQLSTNYELGWFWFTKKNIFQWSNSKLYNWFPAAQVVPSLSPCIEISLEHSFCYITQAVEWECNLWPVKKV